MLLIRKLVHCHRVCSEKQQNRHNIIDSAMISCYTCQASIHVSNALSFCMDKMNLSKDKIVLSADKTFWTLIDFEINFLDFKLAKRSYK